MPNQLNVKKISTSQKAKRVGDKPPDDIGQNWSEYLDTQTANAQNMIDRGGRINDSVGNAWNNFSNAWNQYSNQQVQNSQNMPSGLLLAALGNTMQKYPDFSYQSKGGGKNPYSGLNKEDRMDLNASQGQPSASGSPLNPGINTDANGYPLWTENSPMDVWSNGGPKDASKSAGGFSPSDSMYPSWGGGGYGRNYYEWLGRLINWKI